MKVLSRVVQLNKHPTQSNLERGNFCVYQSEVDKLQHGDTIIVNVFNEDEELVAQPVYSYVEFTSNLKRWKKTSDDGVPISGLKLSFVEY